MVKVKWLALKMSHALLTLISDIKYTSSNEQELGVVMSKVDALKDIIEHQDVDNEYLLKCERQLTRVLEFVSHYDASLVDELEDLVENVSYLVTLKNIRNYSISSLNDSPVVVEIRKSISQLSHSSQESLIVADSVLKNSGSLDIVETTAFMDKLNSASSELLQPVVEVHKSILIMKSEQSLDSLDSLEQVQQPIETVPNTVTEVNPTLLVKTAEVPVVIPQVASPSKLLASGAPDLVYKPPTEGNEILSEAELVPQKKYKLKNVLEQEVYEEGSITEYNFNEIIHSIDFSSQDVKELSEQILTECKKRKYKVNDAFYDQLFIYTQLMEMTIQKKCILHLLSTKSKITEAFMMYAPQCDAMESLKYYIKAAEAGNVDAMYTVADIYYTGKGVDIVVYIAEKWYTSAAEKGHEKSRLMLKEIRHKKKKRVCWQVTLSMTVLLLILGVIAVLLGPKSLK